MKKTRFLGVLSVFAAVLALTLMTAALSVSAADGDDYRDSYLTNLNAQNYRYYSSAPVRSYLIRTGSNELMRFEAIEYHEDGDSDKPFIPYQVEYYDAYRTLTGSREIPLELPLFGGFYSSSDSYFIVSGQSNTEENGGKEVVRITRYDKSWNRLSSSSIYGADTWLPFRSGSLRAVEYNGKLMIRTSHQMFDHGDGLNHQSNFTIVYDLAGSRVERYYTLDEGDPYGYASHSFNQFVLADGNYVVSLDHGDAYPRSIVLSKKNPSTFGAYSGWDDGGRVNVISIPGDIGVNSTGITIGGFEQSSNNYMIAGSKVDDLSRFAEYDLTKNIFVAVVSKDLSNVTVRQITSYTEDELGASTPHLVKIGENRFVLLWTEKKSAISIGQYYTYYVELDGYGNVTSTVRTIRAPLSDCKPIVCGDRLVWYIWQGHDVLFYEIDLFNMNTVYQTHLIDGKRYVAPHLADGTETVASGKLDSSVDYQINKSGNMYIFGDGSVYDSGSYFNSFKEKYGSDHTIKKVWIERGIREVPNLFSGLRELESIVLPENFRLRQGNFCNCPKLKRINLTEGPGYLPSQLFMDCVSLEEIRLPEGLEYFDGSVFQNCTSLKSIEIPEGVENIGYRCFDGCTSLKSVALPESLEWTGAYTFSSCTSLEKINIPRGFKSISSGMFMNCTSLKSIALPDGLTDINNYAFAGCKALQGIGLPESLEYIQAYAFLDCTSIKFVTIPAGVKSIGFHPFGYVSSESSDYGEDYSPFVIRGKKGSAAEEYALYNYITFAEDKPLANASVLGSSSIRLGQTMTVKTGAEGGAAYYRYSIYTKAPGEKKWTAYKMNTTAAAVSVKPVHSGRHYVRIRVTDLENSSAERVIGFDVYAPLKNRSAISSKTVILGKTIVVVPKATGGSGGYTYTVKYKKAASSKWTVLRPDSKDGKLRMKPSAAVKYDIKVTVKDSRGVSVSKPLSLSVRLPLTNRSTLSASAVQLGKSVKVSARAAGGMGGNRYAVYYKKTSSAKWITLQDYGTKTYAVLKPKAATAYDVCVKVKDSSRTIVKKYFKLTVFMPLKNLSTISAFSVKKGGKVRITCKASGGTGGYSYGVFYKKASAKSWITLVNYSGAKTAVFKPAAVTGYNVCVIVKDSKGNVERKYYNISVRA